MERHNTLRPGLLLAACALTLVLPISLARSEVSRTGEPEPPASPERIAPVPVPVHDTELRAQCWQQGVKIIDQADLQGLSLNAATRERTVSFKRQAEQQPSVFILPFADGLCLVQPTR
jgi:hypothetical protein